ncbi:MAG: anaerobic sulfatase maturase [Halanaerobiales bacterium]|nr:anaerobic sulfatase maturase [Halanaerobiales bacterium]
MNSVPFNIMVFPIGPLCNMDCKYCYYKDKTKYYSNVKEYKMSEKLLENFIEQYVEAHPGPVISFNWQGGEPTLRGLDFFKKAVCLEKKYVPEDWEIENNFQTNGLLIDEKWANFFKKENFLIGLSIDGPGHLNDIYRKTNSEENTTKKVLESYQLLNKFDVETNILCVVNSSNVKKPLEVYNFYKKHNMNFLQFIPLVETDKNGKVTKRSVDPMEYGKFLLEIFDNWLLNDYGEIYIQFFEQCANAWYGREPSLCMFSKQCGKALAMEHNGDLYACDHFVSPEYKIGNINDTHLKDLVFSSKQNKFGKNKYDRLSQKCIECKYYFVCHGGCPKNRLNESNINYLCEGYKTFLNYTEPFFKSIVKGIKKRKHPRIIKTDIKNIHDNIWKDVNRNDPCPCGSGSKYKICCLDRKE